MALSLEVEMESYEDGQPITLFYHKVRAIACDAWENSTGISVESYLSKEDFESRGWNNPRGGRSFFYYVIPDQAGFVDWTEKAIIARTPTWSGATQVE